MVTVKIDDDIRRITLDRNGWVEVHFFNEGTLREQSVTAILLLAILEELRK